MFQACTTQHSRATLTKWRLKSNQWRPAGFIFADLEQNYRYSLNVFDYDLHEMFFVCNSMRKAGGIFVITLRSNYLTLTRGVHVHVLRSNIMNYPINDLNDL